MLVNGPLDIAKPPTRPRCQIEKCTENISANQMRVHCACLQTFLTSSRATPYQKTSKCIPNGQTIPLTMASSSWHCTFLQKASLDSVKRLYGPFYYNKKT